MHAENISIYIFAKTRTESQCASCLDEICYPHDAFSSEKSVRHFHEHHTNCRKQNAKRPHTTPPHPTARHPMIAGDLCCALFAMLFFAACARATASTRACSASCFLIIASTLLATPCSVRGTSDLIVTMCACCFSTNACNCLI